MPQPGKDYMVVRDNELTANTVLETDRLILRPWRESDAPALFAIAKDPEVGPNAGWIPHESVEYSRTIIRTIYLKRTVFAIVPKPGLVDCMGIPITSGFPIGNITLAMGPNKARGTRENQAELGYWLGRRYWHLGFASEAAFETICYGFRNLNLDQIWCTYYKGNTRSRRVMKRLGFYWHHTIKSSYNPMLKTSQTEYYNCFTRDDFEQLYGEKGIIYE